MTTIWKFPVRTDAAVMMPVGARILHVANQPYVGPCLWAEIDPDAPEEPRQFAVVGTGQMVPEGASHLGTWLDGQFVWHLYEMTDV